MTPVAPRIVKTLIIDPCHIYETLFNYNVRSNRCHCSTSPNTAPATKNDRPKSQRNLLKTDETSFTMHGRSENETVRPQPASQPRLLFTPTTSILH